MAELDLGLPAAPERRPRRAFYAGVAMSTNSVQVYGTPLDLFDAICRWKGGLQETCLDVPPEQLPRPWVDPFASSWNALVPYFFSLPGEGGAAVDGLRQSWEPPAGASRFIVFNPVYEEAENPCSARCQKKRCEERGFCLSQYKPGMLDALLKAESEALMWGGPIIGVLPARQASWFQRIIAPPAGLVGAFLGGQAWPAHLAPAARFMKVAAQEVYRYERLEVTTVRLAERQAYRVPPGAVHPETGKPIREDAAGFDTLLVAWERRDL